VRLTDSGRALVDRAERLLADATSVVEEMRGFAEGLRGRVALGTYQSFAEYRLPKLLGRFHALYPGIEIALREGLSGDLVAALRSGELDAYIGDVGDDAPSAVDEFEYEALFEDELAIAISPSHRLARRASIEFHELRDEPWVIFRPGSASTRRLYDLARTSGFTPRAAFESVDSITVRALVAERLGVALFPRALGNTPGPNIVLLSLAPNPIVRHISLVQRRVAHGPSARTFLNFIREELLAE
jgi:DNA-binding transcriptional LysR family regulator